MLNYAGRSPQSLLGADAVGARASNGAGLGGKRVPTGSLEKSLRDSASACSEPAPARPAEGENSARCEG